MSEDEVDLENELKQIKKELAQEKRINCLAQEEIRQFEDFADWLRTNGLCNADDLEDLEEPRTEMLKRGLLRYKQKYEKQT